MSIPFTQYLLPNGRQRPASLNTHATIEIQAYELIDAGYVFEVEMLSNGVIHMDCHQPGDELPISLQLCDNGPQVLEAVQNLVLDSHSYAFPEGQADD